jgi:hypothetical protein
VVPSPFRPKLVRGYAIGGICLIRLGGVRPRGLPIPLGIGSENCAHRFSVEWDAPGGTQAGVFISRRDTSSAINALLGGRLFPGVHHRAEFTVREEASQLAVALQSTDGVTRVEIEAAGAAELPSGSVFGTLAGASAFFEAGSRGYSPNNRPGTYDGLELRTQQWSVTPLAVGRVKSSFFDDAARFPPAPAPSTARCCGLPPRKGSATPARPDRRRGRDTLRRW